MWLQLREPDPEGTTLRLLAPALKAFVCDAEDGGQYGVFVSYCSLLQEGASGEPRTELEELVYQRAVDGLAELYSHPRTIVLKVTRAEGDGETSARRYHERGWCYAESAMASLTKNRRYVLDVGLLPSAAALGEPPLVDPLTGAVRWSKVRSACVLQSGRRPPLTPAAFAAVLGRLSFACKAADEPRVLGLYEGAYRVRLGEAQQLFFSYLGWADEEARLLAEMLHSAVATRLEQLFLSSNQIGDEGLAAIIQALAHGASPSLRELSMHGNPCSEEAIAAARAALAPRQCYLTLSDEYHIDQTARRRSMSGQL